MDLCCLLQHSSIQTGFPINPSSSDFFFSPFFWVTLGAVGSSGGFLVLLWLSLDGELSPSSRDEPKLCLLGHKIPEAGGKGMIPLGTGQVTLTRRDCPAAFF